MNFGSLRFVLKPVFSSGVVYKDHTHRFYNMLRLKKEIIIEIPGLESNDVITYEAELWRTYEEFLDRVKEICKKKEGIPLLIFLHKNGKQQ